MFQGNLLPPTLAKKFSIDTSSINIGMRKNGTEGTSSAEILIKICQTTECPIPEDSNLQVIRMRA
jgi:hypothetical protein